MKAQRLCDFRFNFVVIFFSVQKEKNTLTKDPLPPPLLSSGLTPHGGPYSLPLVFMPQKLYLRSVDIPVACSCRQWRWSAVCQVSDRTCPLSVSPRSSPGCAARRGRWCGWRSSCLTAAATLRYRHQCSTRIPHSQEQTINCHRTLDKCIFR